MTSHSPLSLEDFGSDTQQVARAGSLGANATATSEQDISDAYEKGYRAGWDDCLEGSKADQKHIAEAFGRRLGEAQVTLQEARSKLLGGLKPLLADIMQKLLPTSAQTGFRAQLIEQIMDLAKQSTDAPIEVRVAEEDLAAVQSLVSDHAGMPEVTLIADPALGMTQALLKVGKTGRSIDIMEVIDGIESAFDTILHEQEEDLKIG